MASLLVDLQPASNLSLSRRMNMAADGAGGGWLDVRQTGKGSQAGRHPFTLGFGGAGQ
jgi:hypothetical protein